MANEKESSKASNQESPADRIKREKAEAEAKVAAEASTPPEEDPAIAAERAARFARAEAFEKEREAKRAGNANPAPAATSTDAPTASGNVGMDKLHKIAQALPSSTPNEHVMFGLAGIKVTAGDIREVCGMRR
jgi:hypothetical protein